MMLEDLKQLEEQMEQLDGEMATLLEEHQDVVRRLAEVPGLGVSSAVQIIAEVGPRAEVFDSAKELSSWVVSGKRRECGGVEKYALTQG
jgi:transposase